MSAQRQILHSYGPWAVVTGASSGIGRAFAELLAAQGLNLVLVARSQDRLHATADSLAQRHQISLKIVAVDLGTLDGPVWLLAQTKGLDVGLLVQAAGFGTAGDYLAIPAEAELDMIGVNCRAVQELARGFGERFAARGRGGMILLSSIVAFQGAPRSAVYAATKAFVQTLAEGIAPDLAARGVDVLAVAPGPVRTGFAKRARMTMASADTADVVARQTVAALGHRRTVVPGTIGKLLNASLSMLPRTVRTAIMGRAMAGMTRHQDGQQAGQQAGQQGQQG